MNASRALFLVAIGGWMVGCGAALPSAPAMPAIPSAPSLAAPASPATSSSTATNAQATADAPAQPAAPIAKESAAPAALDDSDREKEAEKAKAPAPPPLPEPTQASGKLLTKPAKGTFQIELGSNLPAVGDEAELSRVIDKSVPLFGGGYIVIAKAEVVKVDGKKVTLKMVEERAQMKINGKKLDHFTPGVAIRVTLTKKAP